MRFQRRSAAALLVLACGVAPVSGPYPPTPQVAVVEHRFGYTWHDPYRWLEDDAAPAVRAWAAEQRRYALHYLDAQPQEAALHARITALSKTSTRRFDLSIRRGRWIYERLTPPQAQPELVSRVGIHGVEHVLYDAVSAAHGGVPEAIESVFPSPDGRRVAFTTQAGGSEEETLHVVDATGASTTLTDTIPHAGGGVSPSALAWDADGRGFVYARYPLDGPLAERHFNITLYHHRLGTSPASDHYVFGHGQSRVAEYVLRRSPDGARLAAFIEPGDSGTYAVWVQDGQQPFRQLATTDDAIVDGTFLGSTLLVRSSLRHSTYDVFALAPGATFANATIYLHASAMPLEGLAVDGRTMFAAYLDAGESIVRTIGTDGRILGTLPVPPHITLTAAAADPHGGSAVFGYQSYGISDRWVAYDAATHALVPTGVVTRAPGDFSHLVVTRVFVRSLDGHAKIPLTVVHLPGIATDGTAPTILTAYGGYGINTTPFFLGTQLAWLEHGGVFAQANVRGGGEYGAAWHRAALHATKTKTADDLASCARWLETHGYGDRTHLGIIGGSDGGFLMGMAITRDPALYRAVVGEVGIYDIPRWQLSPNGASNIPEFGDARKARDFAYIIKQSPYQNVHDGVAYPAMLMTTGKNDPRVSPMNSRKMTARLQAASSSGYPILLIQNAGEGHGIGSSLQQRIDNQTAVLTFFASQLGLRTGG